MKRFVSTLAIAIKSYFPKRWMVKSIRRSIAEIHQAAKKLIKAEAILTGYKDPIKINKLVRQAIMFVVIHEYKIQQAESQEMRQAWENFVNQETETTTETRLSEEQEDNWRKFADMLSGQEEQRWSEQGLGDTFLYTFEQYKKAERICAWYKFFEAIYYRGCFDLQPDNRYFIQAGTDELVPISHILQATLFVIRQEIKRQEKTGQVNLEKI
jgi:hypothetical protein